MKKLVVKHYLILEPVEGRGGCEEAGGQALPYPGTCRRNRKVSRSCGTCRMKRRV